MIKEHMYTELAIEAEKASSKHGIKNLYKVSRKFTERKFVQIAARLMGKDEDLYKYKKEIKKMSGIT